MMVRYLIRFSYIGTKYKGLQNLPHCKEMTIQGVLEMALQKLYPLNVPVTTTASRTDKGVHALANALHVDLEHRLPGEVFQPHHITDRMNFFLKTEKHDIVVTKTSIVPDTFSARWCADWRSYIYRIAVLNPNIKPHLRLEHAYDEFLPICERDRCFLVHGSLDMLKMQEAAKLFLGTHNFTTFTRGLTRNPKNPVKTMYEVNFYPLSNTNFILDPQYQNISMWAFYIRGNSFLYHQVRKVLGVLVSVGYGYLSLDNVKAMLNEPSTDNWRKASLPPPGGLYLSDIHYRRESFLFGNTNELEASAKVSEECDDH